MANKYDKGDRVRISVDFKVSGTLTDPSTVTFKHKKPDGTITTWVEGTDTELVKDSTGKYHVDLDPDAAGTWFYRFEGTGTVVTAEESNFAVPKSNF